MKMENIINRIIEIDKSAANIHQKTEGGVNENDRILKSELEKIEKKLLNEGKVEGEKLYEKIVMEGEGEVKKIEEKGQHVYERIQEIYMKGKDNLSDELFKNIFTFNN